MATNKFATMFNRNNTHKITLVLIYAILEWILIFLLLLNSLLYFLISKFALYFGLKPPCTFCSTLNKNKNIYKYHIICERHAYEISQFDSKGEEKSEGELLETKQGEEIEFHNDNNFDPQIYGQDNDVLVEGVVDVVQEKNTNEVFEKMEIGELVSSIIIAMQDLVSVATEEAQSPCNDINNTNTTATNELNNLQETEGEEDDCQSSDGELEFEFFKGMVSSSPRGQLDQAFKETDKVETSNRSLANNVDQELNGMEIPEFPQQLLPYKNGSDEISINRKDFDDDDDTRVAIEKLKMELKAEREALNALYSELEEERNASAVAASQTMNMMTRLQQEKAAMQMEAQQYQRMMEEQSEYDQEALQLLNDLMVKKEKEKQELEKELEVYRKRVQDYELAQEQIPLTPHNNYMYGQPSTESCHILGSGECLMSKDNINNGIDTKLDFEEMGIDPVKNMSLIDESLGEFEVERLSILEELKALEMKLVTLANDDDDDINQSGYHTYYPKYEGNNFENAMIVNVVEPKELLPFYDENEKMKELEEIESSSSNKIKCLDYKFKMVNKRVRIEEEMGHVYERLQGLETDRDFLKHCIVSLSEGDQGIYILKEILQHLRDLRTVEDHATSIYIS